MKKATILICMMAALAGCGTSPDRTDYKAHAKAGRPLDMPPDLVLPKGDGKYVVPSGGKEVSATYSEYARSGALQGQSCACPNTTVAPAPAPVAAPVPATLQNKSGGRQVIVMAEQFDRCWLRVSQAMDAAGISAADKDRSKGLFYLQNHNQLRVHSTGAGKSLRCEVSASDRSGKFSAEPKMITDTLYKALR